jgi:hypothetical protein
MSSDADYEAFLNRANQDASSAQATSQPGRTKGILTVDTEVPNHLLQVKEFMVSDSDEPFEPLSLKFEGDKLPSAGRSFAFKQFIV